MPLRNRDVLQCELRIAPFVRCFDQSERERAVPVSSRRGRSSVATASASTARPARVRAATASAPSAASRVSVPGTSSTARASNSAFVTWFTATAAAAANHSTAPSSPGPAPSMKCSATRIGAAPVVARARAAARWYDRRIATGMSRYYRLAKEVVTKGEFVVGFGENPRPARLLDNRHQIEGRSRRERGQFRERDREPSTAARRRTDSPGTVRNCRYRSKVAPNRRGIGASSTSTQLPSLRTRPSAASASMSSFTKNGLPAALFNGHETAVRVGHRGGFQQRRDTPSSSGPSSQSSAPSRIESSRN